MKIILSVISEPLEITSFALYESDDVQVTTIAKVLKEETISADLIQATSVVTDGLYAQEFESNTKSRNALIAKAGDIVNYIRIAGKEQGFYTDVLGSEQEQFKRTITVGSQEIEYSYWWSQIEGEFAHTYLSTIDPRVKFPEISDSNRDKFRYMVLKPESTVKKLSFEFALDELGNDTPSIILGSGIGAEDGVSGKGFIYKNTNGFYHIYCQSDGDRVGIVMDDNGVHITGWADQHCESILFVNNGVELKFAGEETHKVEYVFNENEVITSLIEDHNYITTFGYEDRTL